QAEDGIRDFHVTGVQTCALPIYEVGGKIGEYLRESLELLPLSYKLATIQTDCNLTHDIEEITPPPVDRQRLAALYQTLEFRSWAQEVERDLSAVEASANGVEAAEEQVAVNGDYETILTQDAWQSWLDRLKAAPAFAFDTETTSLNYIEARIVGISFAIESGKAAYVPLAHDYLGAPEQLSRDQVLEDLRPLLEDPSKAKIGQNLKYDMNVLANHGIHMRGIAEDTM